LSNNANAVVELSQFLPLHATSNGAVMPSLDVRPSVCLSVCNIGDSWSQTSS